MIKAIIIDDELHCLETLSLLLQQYCPEVQLLGQCRSAKTGITAILEHHPFRNRSGKASNCWG